jgi:hypothetical protein
LLSSAGLAVVASEASRRRVAHQAADQFFSATLAVHVGHQIRQLLARFEQLAQSTDLLGDGRRREVVHVLECQVDADVAFACERVGHVECDARLHRLHARVEVVDVDLEELAVGHRGQGIGRLARQVRHHTHHEGQLDLLLGAINLDVVLDLNAWGAIAGDELLAASHVALLSGLLDRLKR